ncbi:MAG: hypothetical protein N2484_08125 [Clostridia bacterium]|nr:hypothetical protein [Clostridia bacterium]
MAGIIRRVLGIISTAIFLTTVLLYLEGFIFYSFHGNLGFLLSFFAGPIGLVAGLVGMKGKSKLSLWGVYGNAATMIFGFLFIPFGYIMEWVSKGLH